MKKILTIALSFFISSLCFAQEKPEMADVMRSNGKIYTVVAVCVTILLGLFAYVFNIDRKISKIEKKQN